MPSSRKSVSDEQIRERRGNDEQEGRFPYGGERATPPARGPRVPRPEAAVTRKHQSAKGRSAPKRRRP
jgi:hypothetical protein